MDGSGFNSAPVQVALLVDGDNLASTLAARIVVAAGKLGRVTVKRVYADVQHLQHWANGATGFVLRTAGSGKNASDILMIIEAVDLFWRDGLRHFAIASSDRDLSSVALYLVERGATVLGLGEPKAPAAFRDACSRFEVVGEQSITPPALPAPRPVTVKGLQATAAPSRLDDRLRDIVRKLGVGGAMPLAALGGQLHKMFSIQATTLPEGGLRAYLAARPGLFELESRGPEARVRCRW